MKSLRIRLTVAALIVALSLSACATKITEDSAPPETPSPAAVLSTSPTYAFANDYLAENMAVINTNDLDGFARAASGLALDGFDLYMIGEGHSIANNYELYLFLIRYFHEYHGINTVYLEFGYVDVINCPPCPDTKPENHNVPRNPMHQRIL